MPFWLLVYFHRRLASVPVVAAYLFLVRRMRLLVAAIALSLVGCLTTPPEEPSVSLSRRDTLDVFEAAVRSRLTAAPLARHSSCYFFLNEGALPELAARFPEYRTVIRSGSPGRSPPTARWYYLHLGGTFVDHAFVVVEDSRGGLIVELRRHGSRWTAVGTRPAIVT
jgi:hypothetical protein